MLIPILIVFTLYFLLMQEVLFAKQKKKTPEEKLKEAFTKYVSQVVQPPKE